MEAQTEIEQALLTQIGKIQKNWRLAEERLTKLVENMSEEEKEREKSLTKNMNTLNGNLQTLFNNQKSLQKQLDSFSTQFQSMKELPEQLKALEKLLKNG